ncbi:Stp1/IreP family PP2C-type Ser/Thr phosphatase [Jeongeupia chitinilytica]|uniref:Protein phosphatase PrpC n=1 Tax=Jeongeupia chitinilytica TaxID=1041641 RepID=A0ABQ3GYH8_9NEIS|nr:Stp1/IreP family PP2C-type Ser/Thr phosphatase [Jeongeupia chitinilytica]GHD61343.1 protein phosphatase PrpC [Jeongeupia chitinilytica]
MARLSQALEMVGQTDPGLVRAQNEDAIAWDADAGFVVLADGMGGYNAGEVASAMAVDVLSRRLSQPLPSSPLAHSTRLSVSAWLTQSIDEANRAIYNGAITQPQCAGMGTTLVSALFYDNRVLVAHVGDSRMYRLRNAELTRLTHDHSLLQEQIDLGLVDETETRQAAQRNLLTRAVGIDTEVHADLSEFDAEPGDVYLLCSDGLTDMVGDVQIADIILTLKDNAPLAAMQLVQAANHHGGHDNISVILVAVRRAYPADAGFWSRLTAWLS